MQQKSCPACHIRINHGLKPVTPMKTASFDNWTIVFLGFSFLAFLLALFFLIRYVPGKKAHYLLALYIFLYGITMIEYVLHWTGYIVYWPLLQNISFCFPLLLGPLVYFYLREVFEGGFRLRKYYFHFLPFAVFFALTEARVHLAPSVAKKAFYTHSVLRFIYQHLHWMMVGWMFFYTLLAYLFLRRQPHAGHTRKWAHWLLFLFFLFALSHLAYYLLLGFSFFNRDWDYFVSMVISATVLTSAWFGFAYPAIFQGYPLREALGSAATIQQAGQLYIVHQETPFVPADNENMPPTPLSSKYKNSGLTPSAGKRLSEKLQLLMEKEKVYRENDISLDKLSKWLDASRHHVSQIINEYHHVSFFDYINQLRIEEAKQMLKEKSKKELNAIEVAYLVGFNNKVSFIQAFKKATGMTPGQFRSEEKG
jgi:AraC-like DNA-binding protein